MSLTPQSVGILNCSAKKARGKMDGGGVGGMGSRSNPTSGEWTVTTGLIPSSMTHLWIGLLG